MSTAQQASFLPSLGSFLFLSLREAYLTPQSSLPPPLARPLDVSFTTPMASTWAGSGGHPVAISRRIYDTHSGLRHTTFFFMAFFPVFSLWVKDKRNAAMHQSSATVRDRNPSPDTRFPDRYHFFTLFSSSFINTERGGFFEDPLRLRTWWP